MSSYTVTAVRKELSSDRTHRHLEGVFTSAGVHWTRQEVVSSISAGDTWQTSAGGYRARIHALHYCPHGSCVASSYIATNPDSSFLDNLENLPEL